MAPASCLESPSLASPDGVASVANAARHAPAPMAQSPCSSLLYAWLVLVFKLHVLSSGRAAGSRDIRRGGRCQGAANDALTKASSPATDTFKSSMAAWTGVNAQGLIF